MRENVISLTKDTRRQKKNQTKQQRFWLEIQMKFCHCDSIENGWNGLIFIFHAIIAKVYSDPFWFDIKKMGLGILINYEMYSNRFFGPMNWTQWRQCFIR